MLNFLVLPLAALSFLDFAAGSSWLPDVASFFRPWLNGVLLIFAIAAWRRLTGRYAVLMACSLILYSAGTLRSLSDMTLELAAGAADDGVSAANTSLKVVTFNVLRSNINFKKFTEYLKNVSPDVAVLQEAEDGWPDVIKAHFPYIRSSADVVVASHYPFMLGQEQSDLELSNKRIVRAVILVPVGLTSISKVSIYGLHAMNARNYQDWKGRNEAFDEVAAAIKAEKPHRPVIIAGDLNMSSWSLRFSSLLSSTGTIAGSTDTLFAATRFFSGLGLPVWFGAPVDHILVRKWMKIEQRTVGPPLGSDHVPVAAIVLFGSKTEWPHQETGNFSRVDMTGETRHKTVSTSISPAGAERQYANDASGLTQQGSDR
ncbi:endonuclease/exonuclease/phosphatase family protein [Mesorhizobium sp. A556]